MTYKTCRDKINKVLYVLCNVKYKIFIRVDFGFYGKFTQGVRTHHMVNRLIIIMYFNVFNLYMEGVISGYKNDSR